MAHVALVIRRDGTVPIEPGHPHRADIIAALRAEGHALEHAAACDHYEGGPCTCDPKIKGWQPK